MNSMYKMPKIVLTGGPGGGKTTALDLFRRELCEKIVVVPEAATMLFNGGVRRSNEEEVVKETQRTIFQLQKNLESIQHKLHPDRLVICDRGTLDGLAYWPGKNESYFYSVGTTYEDELEAYDAVIFFETAAASGQTIHSNNPVRNESLKEAIEIDKRLQDVWSKHSNYYFVGSNESFVEKIMFGINTIHKVIKDHNLLDW